MGETQQVFDGVLAELEPTATQKDGAQRSHRYLRELLEGGKIGLRIREHYLSGSYARDTAIQPLDDVDVVFVIDPTEWKTPFFSSHPAPGAILRTFVGAIRRRYKESSLRTQRRSVRLRLFHLDIDVVPAIADPKDPELIRIPDATENEWILSAPKKHTRRATEVNKLQRNLFKPLVKLLKGWNANLPEQAARMKSFAVETMAIRLFSDTNFSSLEEGTLLFWDFLAWLGGESSPNGWSGDRGVGLNRWAPRVLDAAGTGSDTLGSPPRTRCQRFMEYARQSRDLLGEGIRARSAERTEKLVRHALRRPT